MPRTPKGTPPSYRRHSSGQACVTVRDHSGRRREILLGPWGSPESRAEYARILAEAAAHQGRLPGPDHATPLADGITVDSMILAFWRHAEGHYAKSRSRSGTTELDNLRLALRPLRSLYGRAPAAEFGPAALRAVRESMVQSRLSRSTINARVNRIRRAFRWAASVELIPATVVQALETVPGLQRGRSRAPESSGVSAVPVEHVEAAIPFMPDPVAAMVRIQLLTGCRTEEVLAMRGAELVPGEPNWEFRPADHKNAWRGVGRVIPLGPRARRVVEAWLKPDPAAYMFSPRETVRALQERRSGARKTRRTPSELSRRSESPGGRHADHYSRRSYRQAIVRACRRAGVPEWTPLQLRHTAATAIRAKFGLEAAQTVLGHARADVTQLYAERNLARAHEVMKEIG